MDFNPAVGEASLGGDDANLAAATPALQGAVFAPPPTAPAALSTTAAPASTKPPELEAAVFSSSPALYSSASGVFAATDFPTLPSIVSSTAPSRQMPGAAAAAAAAGADPAAVTASPLQMQLAQMRFLQQQASSSAASFTGSSSYELPPPQPAPLTKTPSQQKPPSLAFQRSQQSLLLRLQQQQQQQRMDAYAAAAAAATGIPLTKMELSCIVVGKPAPSPPFAISVLPTTSIYQMREYVALRLESSLLARRLTHLDLDLYRADTGPIFSDDPKLEMLSVSAHAFAPSDIRSTIPATLMTTDVRATVAHFFTAGQTFSSFAKANGLTEGRRLFAAVDVIVAVRKDAFLDSRSIDEGYEDSSSSHSEGSVKFAPAGTIHVAGDDFTVPSPAQKRRSQVTFQQDHEITFQGISRPKSSTTFSASFRNSLRDLQLAALANANSAMAGTPTSTEFQLMVQQQILQQQLQQSQQFEFNASNTSSPDNLTLRTYGGASSTKTGDEAAITAVAAAEAYFRKTSHDLNSMSFAQASMAIERPTPVAQPGRKSEEGFLPSLHNAAGPQALSAVGRSRTASVASVRTLGDSRPKSLSSLRMRRLARRFLRGPWLAAIIVGGVFLVAAIALLVVLWPRPVNVETISMVQQPGVPTNGTGAANGSFSVISMLVVGLRSNGVIPLSLRNATASGSLVDGGSGGAALLFSAILDGNSSATLPPGTTTPIQLPSTMTLSGTGNQVAAPQSFADAISIVCRQLQNPASLEMTYNLSLDFPLYSWAGFKPQLQGKFALSCPAH